MLLEKLTHIDNNLRRFLLKFLSSNLFISLYSITRTPYLKFLSKSLNIKNIDSNNKRTLFESIIFKNDIGVAAGFDKDGNLLEFNYLMGAGFSIVGTVLNRKHSGNNLSSLFKNIPPWTPLPNSNSAINSLGLPNKGVDQVVKNIKKFKSKYEVNDFPIGISVMGHPLDSDEEKVDSIIEVIEKSYDVVDFYEINESCPNTDHDKSDSALEKRLEKIFSFRNNQSVYKPIFVKLGVMDNLSYSIKYFTDFGVDALVLVNTQKDYSKIRESVNEKDLKLFDYYTAKYKGGVSGELIKDYSFDLVKKVSSEIKAQKSNLKIIHIGGISSKEDLLKSRAIDKDIVVLRQWYTGLMEAMSKERWKDIYPNLLSNN